VVRWDTFEPADFEYDFENDKLAVHRVTFEVAVETFFSRFRILSNKKDRIGFNSMDARWLGVLWKSFLSSSRV
jgi:hypothetical protein